MGVTKEGVESTLTAKLQPTHLVLCSSAVPAVAIKFDFDDSPYIAYVLQNADLAVGTSKVMRYGFTEAIGDKCAKDFGRSRRQSMDEAKGPCKPICALTTLPPDLKHIKPDDRKLYRQGQIQQWLENMVLRAPRECFGHYTGRVYTMASRDLSFDAAARSCMGDEFPHFLDRYVWRILQGARLDMIKHGVVIEAELEKQYLALLREEVEELFNDDQILPDPRLKMEPGDTWVHENEHCAASRAARECEKDAEHKSGFHEAKCDGTAGKNFKSF